MDFGNIHSIVLSLTSYRSVLPFIVFLLIGCSDDQDNSDRPDCLITYLSDGENLYNFNYDRSYKLTRLNIEHKDYICEIDYSYFSDHVTLDYSIRPKIVVDNIQVYEGRRIIWTNEFGQPLMIEEEDNTLSGYLKYLIRFTYEGDNLKYVVADYGEYSGGYKMMDSVVITSFDESGRNITQLDRYYWFSQENDWSYSGQNKLIYMEKINPLSSVFYVSITENTVSLIMNFFNENLESSFKTFSEGGFLFADCEYSYLLNNRGYPMESSLYCNDDITPLSVLVEKIEYKYNCK